MLLYLFANVFLNWKFSRIFSIYHKYHRETIICSWPGGAGWGVAGCGAAQRPFCVLTTLKDMCAQLTGRYRGQTSQSQVYSLVNRSCILCNLSLERESTGNVLPLDLHPSIFHFTIFGWLALRFSNIYCSPSSEPFIATNQLRRKTWIIRKLEKMLYYQYYHTCKINITHFFCKKTGRTVKPRTLNVECNTSCIPLSYYFSLIFYVSVIPSCKCTVLWKTFLVILISIV